MATFPLDCYISIWVSNWRHQQETLFSVQLQQGCAKVRGAKGGFPSEALPGIFLFLFKATKHGRASHPRGTEWIYFHSSELNCNDSLLSCGKGRVKFMHVTASQLAKKKEGKPCSYWFTPNCFLISLHSICNQRSQIDVQLGSVLCGQSPLMPNMKIMPACSAVPFLISLH